MSTKKIVTVFGATGRQGGGAAKFLLEDGTFHVRAVTRNPESDVSKALAAKGAELIKADLNDKASLIKAMQGAYGVFGITDFWSANGQEETQGKNLVDAAKETGVKHFVWSTLDHSDLNVPHFETKANVNDYLIASGVPRTSLYTGWFYENIATPLFNLKRDTDGTLLIDATGYATDGPLLCISGEDCGYIGGVALMNPDKYIGQDIFASVESATPRQLAKSLEEIAGEKIKIKEMTMEQFDQARGAIWEELWLNMKFFYLNQDKRDLAKTKAAFPKLRTVKEFIIDKGGKTYLLPK